MRKRPSFSRAYPEGWEEAFYGQADLERSFGELAGSGHFFAEALRGRIRSLELRTEAADLHFAWALARAARAPTTISNLRRTFQTEVFLFENALLKEPLNEDFPLESIFTYPEPPAEILTDYAELREVRSQRRRADGILCLHFGAPQLALPIFTELVQNDPQPFSSAKALNLLGLAAAQHQSGIRRAPRRALEHAGWIIQGATETLNALRVAAHLNAFYRYLGLETLAREWLGFFAHLDCPPETQKLFTAWAERIFTRALWVGSLVVL
jgi:hypothetical protein